MKRNMIAVGMLLFFSAVLWCCSDNSNDNPEKDLSLEQSLDAKAVTLSDAVEEITASKGYQIITMKETTKTGDDEGRFSASITLDDIKGDYAYNPSLNTMFSETKFGMQRLFEKTKDTSLFILRLPKEKADRPWKLYMNEDGDDTLVNDFKITTSEYNYSYSSGFKFDYLLNTAIESEGVPAGELFVDWSISDDLKFNYESKYSFTEDYSIGVDFQFGDTIAYQYNLKKAEDVLYKEKIEITKEEGSNQRTFEYSLAIGNIEIVKNSGSEDYKVYRDGTLEEGAVIEVINKNGEPEQADHVFCRKGLDLQITFADESVVILSELIGEETLSKLNEIFSSMYDMYFVKHLVDKVAHEVYYTNMAANN